TERVYLDYSRQQDIKQELYLFLLKKKEETAISKSANIANARVIDEAKATPVPIGPNRSKVFLTAFVFGLFLPALGLVIKDILNVRVMSKDDIVRHTKLPVIGEIGHSDDDAIIA